MLKGRIYQYHFVKPAPSKHECLPNVGTKLDQRLRRWPNFVPTLGKHVVFAWKWHTPLFNHYTTEQDYGRY